MQAALLRFRPIMMTTLAALFGALPLALESGTGSELRNPLGITIIGGLLLSQLLTLYTTPVIYLYMERLRARLISPRRIGKCAMPPLPRSGSASQGRRSPGAAAGMSGRCHRSRDPFIRRPIGTTLLAIGLFLVGAVAYSFLPVASLPSVDFPTIRVTASRPGADPNIMAATVAAPLERRLGEISGVTEMTSVSSLGLSRITIQFDLSRNIDGAARDVQAALNAALSDLPGDLPTLPTFRKANPAAAPILILALTSKTMPPSAIYDAADTVIAQRISQVDGVGDVTVAGAEQPAIRVRVDPGAHRRHGRQPGGRAHRDRQFQRGRPARHLRRRQARRHHRHQRPAARGQRLRPAGGQDRRRHRGPPVEHRLDPRQRAQQPLRRLVQQGAVGPADHHQAGRRQRHRHRRPHLRAAAGTAGNGCRPASTSRSWPTARRPSAPACTTCSSRSAPPSSW